MLQKCKGASSKLERAGQVLLVTSCTLAFVVACLMIFAAVLGKNGPATRDSIEYWASARQLVHGANPYDRNQILALEQGAGLPSKIKPLVMGNLPPSLLLVAPLGFAGMRTAELIWMAALLCCLVVSILTIHTRYGRNETALLLGFTFAPALVCLGAGQISLWILLGLVLFVRWVDSHPVAAGACLWFCTLKPQLFLPFGLVVTAWAVHERKYKLLTGTITAIAVTSLAITWLHPAVWTDYQAMMRLSRYDEATIPCVSIVIRNLIAPRTVMIQYIPAVLGCIWAAWYFRKNHRNWDWSSQGGLVLLVSVVVAPYSWIVDQAIVLPALMRAVSVSRSKVAPALLACGSLAMELGAMNGKAIMHSNFFIWSSPGWLAWYLFATRSRSQAAGSAIGNGPGYAPHSMDCSNEA